MDSSIEADVLDQKLNPPVAHSRVILAGASAPRERFTPLAGKNSAIPEEAMHSAATRTCLSLHTCTHTNGASLAYAHDSRDGANDISTILDVRARVRRGRSYARRRGLENDEGTREEGMEEEGTLPRRPGKEPEGGSRAEKEKHMDGKGQGGGGCGETERAPKGGEKKRAEDCGCRDVSVGTAGREERNRSPGGSQGVSKVE